MDGSLLTARSVAELLSVSSETVLRWTRRGDLPAVRLPGGAIRYRPDELEAWLAARATGADAHEQESPDSPLSHPPSGEGNGHTPLSQAVHVHEQGDLNAR